MLPIALRLGMVGQAVVDDKMAQRQGEPEQQVRALTEEMGFKAVGLALVEVVEVQVQ